MGTREHGGEYICVDGHVTVDQHPFVRAVVIGSKHISRDPLDSALAEEVLDPRGDKAYRIEILRGGLSGIQMCSNPHHLGDRWRDKSEFSPNHYWCKKCERDATFDRRVREAERQGRALREHPGRPRK